MSSAPPAPVLLVPGFWLGAWAWDAVVTALHAGGIEATALTLPGLGSTTTDRSAVGLADHIAAIVDAVASMPAPPVLAVHSGAGFSGYAASDRVADRLAAMIYVDTAPGVGALAPDFTGTEMPLDGAELSAEENLDGLSEEQLATFRERAVPQPGALLREAAVLRNDARRDVRSTFVCTSSTAAQYRAYAESEDAPWLAGIRELHHTTWIDLPTSHWPMWSRPAELATIIADVARAHPRPVP